MAKLRFGLIGFGAIGRVRAQALARSPSCRLGAVCDSDATRRASAPAGATQFAKASELIDSDACDAVIISTPPDSHAELAMHAMERGKHVIVEKPITHSAQATAQMLQCAARTGRTLTVGFNHRYFKGVKHMREAIVRGDLGELRFVKAYTGHVGLPELKAPWMYDKRVMGGGTLMDNGIHVIDLMRYLMGDVHEVSATLPKPVWDVGVEENAFVQMAGANGVLGSLHASWTAWQGYKFRLEACGSDGMAQMSYAPMFSQVVRVSRKPGFTSQRDRRFHVGDIFREKIKGWQVTVIDTFLEEFEDFRAVVDKAARPTSIATGLDGAKAQAIAHAAYESAAGARPVAPLITTGVGAGMEAR